MIHSQGISFFEQLYFHSSTGNQNTPQSQRDTVDNINFTTSKDAKRFSYTK